MQDARRRGHDGDRKACRPHVRDGHNASHAWETQGEERGMNAEHIAYTDGEVTLRGFVAFEEQTSSKRPGILVMPEAFGLGVHAKQRAERLAALGYIALAGDPYGNGRETQDLQEAIQWATNLRADPAQFRQRARVALETLAALPQVDADRLAAIGYCMGGTFALELARAGAPLKGVVSFHGGLETHRPAVAGHVHAKILVCHGADDPFVPPAHVQAFAAEMTKAGVDWQLISYGGTVHSFTNPTAASMGTPGLAYNKHADERSWKALHMFFDEIFGAA
jgi:dienelactone hydrolase